MTRIMTWDGKSVPEELRELPVGKYVVESIDEAPVLSSDEEAGLNASLISLRRGDRVDPATLRDRIDRAIRG